MVTCYNPFKYLDIRWFGVTLGFGRSLFAAPRKLPFPYRLMKKGEIRLCKGAGKYAGYCKSIKSTLCGQQHRYVHGTEHQMCPELPSRHRGGRAPVWSCVAAREGEQRRAEATAVPRSCSSRAHSCVTSSSCRGPRPAPLSVQGRHGGTNVCGSLLRCTACTKPARDTGEARIASALCTHC